MGMVEEDAPTTPVFTDQLFSASGNVQVTGYCARWAKQMAALLYKNVLLAVRNWPAFVLRMITPAMFVFLIWLINILVVAGLNVFNQFDTVMDPEPIAIEPIPDCTQSSFLIEPCWDFFYTPNTSSIATTIVNQIRTNNPGRVIPESAVRGFASMADSNAWLLANQLQTQGVYHFDVSNPQKLGFIIQTNSTVQWFRSKFEQPTFVVQLPMQNAVEREISRYYFQQANQTFSGWNVALKLFAHPPYQRFNVVAETTGPLVFAANMFGFVTLLSIIVVEKELGLRQALRTMGMLDSAYWLSWLLYEGVLGVVTSLTISVVGVICDFDLFRRNAFVTYWALFMTFALAMTSFALFMSVLLRKSASAVYAGFAIFILGWITQTAVLFGFPFTPDNIDNIIPLTVIFMLMPWSSLVKGLQDLGRAVEEASYPGLSAGNMYSYCKSQASANADTPSGQYFQFDCSYSLGQCILLLFGLWIFYALLAVYLDNVLPNERGVRKPFYYFLLPDYWFGSGRFGVRKKRKNRVVVHTPKGIQPLKQAINRPEAAEETANTDEEVRAEEETLQHLLEMLQTPNPEGQAALDKYAVCMFRLQKVFRQRKLCGLLGTKEFWAVKGAQFAIEKGQLLCLLGPNGAGKTTTFNMLTGVIPPNGGDALVYGEALGSAGGLDRIRGMMGVCPQFDILWDELTATEHMRIYALVKGIRGPIAKRQAPQLLAQVKLTEAANQMAGTYSGGMKRRLSVAIALLGDPKIVYLDEPTTGMDPISRRHVWDIIEAAKHGRAIVLTTHSMEEADILGDRIAIMARGRLHALGTSIRLKQRFGSGYQISVAVEANTSQAADNEKPFAEVKRFFKRKLDLEYSDFTGAYMTFRVPQSKESQLPGFLQELEDNTAQLGINDVQMSLTSLEEVFLNIAKKAEVEAAKAEGAQFQTIMLEDGRDLKVPIGEEMVTDAASGKEYKVIWVQDDSGKLQILSHSPVVAKRGYGSMDEDGPSSASSGVRG